MRLNNKLKQNKKKVKYANASGYPFIHMFYGENKSRTATRTPTWTCPVLASQGPGEPRAGRAGDMFPGAATSQVFRHRIPPHPPRPSSSPTQVTPNLGLLRPSLQVSQAPWRNTDARPGQEPHRATTGFPKTKAGCPRPARCPDPRLRPLGA